ncbi:MAG: response regulator [Deltaproteobacteria bacterium]|nr:response regulator [Candidatus Tharpella sp.]
MLSHKQLAVLKAFQNQPEAFDLVLSDMTMPEMNGVELAQKILTIRPDMPIIIATGYSQLINKDIIETFGIKEFLKKPFQKQELASKVRNVLDESGSS